MNIYFDLLRFYLQIHTVSALEFLIRKVSKPYKIDPPLFYVPYLNVALRKQPRL
jgi:hypothetical protein